MGNGRFGRSMRFVGRRMTYANVVATLALVVAMGGTAAAAGVLITSNSQVRHDTISGHQPPSGRHANIIAGSVNGTDLSPKFKATLQAGAHCAKGLQQSAGGLCFDPSPRAAANFSAALQQCRAAKLRLPSIPELAEVFESSDAVQVTQWTSGWTFEGSVPDAPALGQNSSRQIEFALASASVSLAYRCVGNPTN